MNEPVGLCRPYSGESGARSPRASGSRPFRRLAPLGRVRGSETALPLSDAPTVRTKAMWCAVISAAFLICYGGSLHITAARAPVPTLAFAWERHVPFMPAMILPYMSIDLFFLGAFFLSRRHSELLTLVRRLAFVIAFATGCFLLFPLQMEWHRPAIEGMWAAWFAPLEALDRPYNLAPSLHIAQSTILWVAYARHTRGWLRLALGMWFVLIAASTLLTWQHHVFDVVTGQALGLAALYLFREREQREPPAAAD